MIALNEFSKSVIEHPTEDHHSMLVTTKAQEDTVKMPFVLRQNAPIVLLTTPTSEEHQNLPWIELVSQDLEWDPQSSDSAEQEQSLFQRAIPMRRSCSLSTPKSCPEPSWIPCKKQVQPQDVQFQSFMVPSKPRLMDSSCSRSRMAE